MEDAAGTERRSGIPYRDKGHEDGKVNGFKKQNKEDIMDTSTLYRIKNGDTGQTVADGLKENFDTLGAKILEKDEITDLTGYRVNMATLMSESPESEDIATAIGGWDNLVSAVNDRKPVTGYHSGRFTTAVHCEIMSADKIILALHSENTAIRLAIVNADGMFSLTRTDSVLQTASDESLQTENKTVTGAINEVDAKSATIESSVTSLSGSVDSLESSVGSLEENVTSLEGSVASIEESLNGVEEILKQINNERI